MKRKLLTAIAIILFLGIVQFITYKTMSDGKLAKQVIKNIEVNGKLTSDTIIFGSAISIHGNQQETIKPYNLHLVKAENFKLIKDKLSPSVVIEESDYATYCDKASKEACKQLDSAQCALFIDNLHNNKSKLYITALEQQKFFVTVNYNWSVHREFFYEEGQYVWIFFSWLKI